MDQGRGFIESYIPADETHIPEDTATGRYDKNRAGGTTNWAPGRGTQPDRVGAYAEWGVVKWLGLEDEWNRFCELDDSRYSSDVAGYEVKGIEEEHHNLVIKYPPITLTGDELWRWYYGLHRPHILAYPALIHPHFGCMVTIIGWEWGEIAFHEGKEVGPPKFSQPARLYKASKLKDMADLPLDRWWEYQEEESGLWISKRSSSKK